MGNAIVLWAYDSTKGGTLQARRNSLFLRPLCSICPKSGKKLRKMNCTPCLSLWERWTSEARTERVYQGAVPSQSPSATALPEGEPRGCAPTRKWSVSVSIRSIDCFMTTCQKRRLMKNYFRLSLCFSSLRYITFKCSARGLSERKGEKKWYLAAAFWLKSRM